MKQTARIIRNNVPYTLLPNGTLYGEPVHAPTVAAVRLLPDPPPMAVTIGSTGASVSGSFYWDSASTQPDDGVLYIKLDALTVGRFRPVTVGSGGPPTGAAGTDVTGTYPSGLTVAKVRGTAIGTAGGALAAGQVLRATGVDTADWGALDLADTDATTNQLPLSKLPQSGAVDGYALKWSTASNQWVPAAVGAVGSGTVLPGNVGQSLDTVTGPVAAWVTTRLETYASVRAPSVFGSQAPADVILVQCRTDADDGGGGLFAYDASDSTTDDNDGTVLVGAGGERFKRIFSGSVDAAWFGVVPSTTGAAVDVAQEMQAAIDATPSGGSLFIRSCDSSDAAGLRYRLKSTNVATGSQGSYALEISKPIRIIAENAFYNNGASTAAGAVFQCDAGIGFAFVRGAGSGDDARYSTFENISAFGTPSGADAHGVYTEGSVRFIRCAFLAFPGCGVFINGDGGGHNANQCMVDNLVVSQNSEHGWFITGQESNGNNFVGINANENGGVGIWDSSFLGNNYAGCQVALNGSDPVGQGDNGEPLGYKTDGGENATVFTGCYTEDSDYHDFGGATIWIGNRTGAGQVRSRGGKYIHGDASYDLGFRAPDLVTGAGAYFIEFRLAPNDTTPTIMSFQLPDIGNGGTRARDRYRFGVLAAHIEGTSTEGYGFLYANSFAAQPFFMSAEAFYRGAGRMVFGNGYYQRSFATTASKWFLLNDFPPATSMDLTAHEVGDTCEIETVTAGGFSRLRNARAGFYYAPVARSTAYSLGNRITPEIDNGHFYQCTTAGTTAATAPTYNTGSGSTTTDGTAVFTEFGTASRWLNVGPVGDDDIRMLSKSVAAGGTITLTDAESEHARIKFTGAPGGALSVVLAAGPATGWVRSFWNACGQTVTVKASSGDTGVAVVNGATSVIFSDGTNARLAAPDATTTTRGVVVLAGDLAGSAATPSVAKVNGTSYPAGGALTPGHVPQVSGVSTVVYGKPPVPLTQLITSPPLFNNDEYEFDTGSNSGIIRSLTNGGDKCGFVLDLPDGWTLTDLELWIQPPGSHGGLPSTMPRFTFTRIARNTGSATLIDTEIDASGSVGAYETYHSIHMAGLSEVISVSATRYMVNFVAEADTNALAGTTVYMLARTVQ